MAPPLHAFLDASLAAAVLAVVVDAAGEDARIRLTGAGAAVHRAAAEQLGADLADDGEIVVVTTPEPTDVADDEVDDFVASVVEGAALVVLGTLSPLAGGCHRGRWPADWAGRFSAHGWRFVDLVRPVLWDDPRFGPDAKEGWLVFVAPGRFPSLGASPAVAMVHPDRVGEAVAAVDAELARLRADVEQGFRSFAHRADLDRLRQRVTAAEAALEDERLRRLAFDARLAATERRALLVLERVLLAETAKASEPPPAPAPAPVPEPPARLRERLRDRLPGRRRRSVAPAPAPVPTAGPPAEPAGPPPSPLVLALFDEASYLREHPEAGDDALGHYLSVGEALGFRPNPWFDPLFYAERHEDVRRSGTSLLAHYAEHGGDEGRPASDEFDTAWYLHTYPEVRQSGLHPMVHFIAVGAALGYRPSPGGSEPPVGGR